MLVGGEDEIHLNASRCPNAATMRFRRICVTLIKVHCGLCGVDLFTCRRASEAVVANLKVDTTAATTTAAAHNNTARRWNIAVPVLAARALLALCIAISVVVRAIRRYLMFPYAPSAYDVIELSYSIIYFALLVGCARAMWRNGDLLRRLFTESTQCVQYLDVNRYLLYALYVAYLTAGNFYAAIYDAKASKSDIAKQRFDVSNASWLPAVANTVKVTDRWCRIYYSPVLVLVAVLYTQSQVAIRERLRRLRASIAVASPATLLEDKASIRRTTSALNAMIAQLLVLLYAKMFALVYRAFIVLFTMRPGQANFRWYRVTHPLLQLWFAYDTAVLGTQVIASCRKTRWAVAAFYKTRMSRDSLWVLLFEMAYDDTLDSFRIADCFTNEKNTLFSYIGVLITCTAILLQFDYRIMAKFDQDKLSFSASHTL